jgi:hypothetical protein
VCLRVVQKLILRTTLIAFAGLAAATRRKAQGKYEPSRYAIAKLKAARPVFSDAPVVATDALTNPARSEEAVSRNHYFDLAPGSVPTAFYTRPTDMHMIN